MSGITVGSKLDQLVELRRRIDIEIATERAAIARGDHRPQPLTREIPATAPGALPRRQEPSPESPDVVRVPVAAVRPGVIRDWALAKGFTDVGDRRIRYSIIEAWAEAHQ